MAVRNLGCVGCRSHILKMHHFLMAFLALPMVSHYSAFLCLFQRLFFGIVLNDEIRPSQFKFEVMILEILFMNNRSYFKLHYKLRNKTNNELKLRITHKYYLYPPLILIISICSLKHQFKRIEISETFCWWFCVIGCAANSAPFSFARPNENKYTDV